MKKRWLWTVLLTACVLLATPSYVRAFRVAGFSDAPSYLIGDLVLVNRAAYDLRLPYTSTIVLSHSEPGRGDMVLFSFPGRNAQLFKRVIGRPGDRVAMVDNHLTINGRSLSYEQVDPSPFAEVAVANDLGAVVEREAGEGLEHLITHTPGAGFKATLAPLVVPEGHYYIIGDNRDNSVDSRSHGPIPQSWIHGRLSRWGPWR